MKKLLAILLISLLAITNVNATEYKYPLLREATTNTQFTGEQNLLRLGMQQAYCLSMLVTGKYIVEYTDKHTKAMSSKGLILAADVLELQAITNSKFHHGNVNYDGVTEYCTRFTKEFRAYFLELKSINEPKINF